MNNSEDFNHEIDRKNVPLNVGINEKYINILEIKNSKESEIDASNKIDDSREILNKDEEIKIGKLFVGGLPFTSNDDALYDYFIQFGEIKEAVVIRDRVTGASKGYGFVTMKDYESATEALKNPNPFLDGRRCNINYAFKNSKKRDKYNQEGSFRYRTPYISQQSQMWNVGFDPYSVYDYRFPPSVNMLSCPTTVSYKMGYPDNSAFNYSQNYDTSFDFQLPQVYPPLIPLAFATPSGSHLAAFYHPYSTNNQVQEVPYSNNPSFNGFESLTSDFQNINIKKKSIENYQNKNREPINNLEKEVKLSHSQKKFSNSHSNTKNDGIEEKNLSESNINKEKNGKFNYRRGSRHGKKKVFSPN